MPNLINALVREGWIVRAQENPSVLLSWTLRDVEGFLRCAGDGRSVDGDGADVLSSTEDPEWPWWERVDEDVPDDVFVIKEDLDKSGVRDCLALIVEVAAKMTHKDVCVLFGRDLFPIQGILEAWQHKLRGTWIYAEGVSSGVAQDCGPTICALVEEARRPGGRVFGVDTGFVGSVPDAALGGLEDGYEVFLMSASHEDRRAFKWDESPFVGDEAEMRGRVSEIEDHPKPFFRCGSVRERKIDGHTVVLPEIHMSCRQDILLAARFWLACYELAKDLGPHLAQIMADSESAPSEVLIEMAQDEDHWRFYANKTSGEATASLGQVLKGGDHV